MPRTRNDTPVGVKKIALSQEKEKNDMQNNMHQKADKPRRLGPNSDPEQFVLPLMYRTRFAAGRNFTGGPVAGITDPLNMGMLPEKYWEAAGTAVYAVYSHETPIVWLTESGVWQAPDHRYSTTTSKYRMKIIRALESQGIAVEML